MMGISGKYDFKGIQKLSNSGIRIALSSSPKTAWILKGGKVTDLFLNLLTNFLSNQGLVFLNVGAIIVDGHLDQRAFDSAMDKAFNEIQAKGGRDKLTPLQMKEIDDEIIKAARKFIVIGKP